MDPAAIESLATDLQEKYPDQAAQVRAPLTLVDEVPAPFLGRYKVLAVQVRSLRHPLLFYAASAPGRPAHLLSSDPNDLVKLLADDGATLDSASDAIAYVRLLVTLDRKSSRLSRIVEAVDEIPLRERLDEASTRKAEAALSGLRKSLSPPTAEAGDAGWTVSLWIARDTGVAIEHFEIARNGELRGHTEDSRFELPMIVVA